MHIINGVTVFYDDAVLYMVKKLDFLCFYNQQNKACIVYPIPGILEM